MLVILFLPVSHLFHLAPLLCHSCPIYVGCGELWHWNESSFAAVRNWDISRAYEWLCWAPWCVHTHTHTHTHTRTHTCTHTHTHTHTHTRTHTHTLQSLHVYIAPSSGTILLHCMPSILYQLLYCREQWPPEVLLEEAGRAQFPPSVPHLVRAYPH